MPLRKYFCTFPQHLIKEPIISYTLGHEFGVVPNIRAASITDQIALVAVDIEGSSDAIDRSVVYLKERGVTVEEISEGEESSSRL
ncbi:MAG: ferredoxin [Planctomycetes bacterium]|jgi:L-aspartate semialdehyde sulfurtransferase ferredoxin|nr:ferredoxin [Planctomycetota bacterium]